MPKDALPAPAGAAPLRVSRWSLLGLALLVAFFWMLVRPFRGVEHDSVLYTLLALARLNPAALAHDLFVRYGTQNEFTVFSPLYAAATRIFGFERAAALLTLATQIGFVCCAYRLARRFARASLALLGVGLLVVLPAYYGSGSVFAYTELFITPRQPAEVFVLAGIISALGGRHILAGICMLAAVLLHPIIAAAGVALWAMLFAGLRHPRAAAATALGAAALIVGLSFSAIGPFAHFDPVWLSILQHRLAYLFPTLWPITQWGTNLVPWSVLLVGALICSQQMLRKLCTATVLTVIIGMAFAVIESDLLHVAVAGQLQTWRWLWLSGVLAALLAPVIALENWRSGGLRRIAVLLLLCAWLSIGEIYSLPAAVLACLCAAATRCSSGAAARTRRGKGAAATIRWISGAAAAIGWDPGAARSRLMIAGTWVLIALSLVIALNQLHEAILQLRAAGPPGQHYYARIHELQVLSFGGILPALILSLATWAAERATDRGPLLLASLAGVACLSLVPYGWSTWNQVRFPAQRRAAFETWRRVIPQSAEVLWPDNPAEAWFLLGRSSYWSLYQMAGMVFSREVTLIGTRREAAVNPILPLISENQRPAADHRRRPERALRAICRLPGVSFFVSWNDLGPTPYPALAPFADRPSETVRLYHCGNADR